MWPHYPLFQSHLDLAHQYWTQILSLGDCVIDATCGNGHDTLKLAKLSLTDSSGTVYALDIQTKAIELSQHYLRTHLSSQQFPRIKWTLGCHSQFPQEIKKASVKLIVYNLGYLPGGSKALTTQVSSTLKSLQQAEQLVMNGGLISMTCYPGHEEGAIEQDAILAYVSSLDPKEWSCCHHQWLNRRKSPSLLLLQKKSD